MKNYLELLRPYWKAALAFGALFGTNVATQLTTSGVPWPTNGGEWVRFLGTTAAGTYLVYQGPRNQPAGKHAAAE